MFNALNQYNQQHRPRFNRILGEVSALLPAGSRILDFGSLTGELSILLKARGFDVSAADLVSICEEFGGIYEENDINLIPIKASGEFDALDSSYDGIIFAETLEHLHDTPLNVLGQLKCAMKPDGVMLVTTPNVKRLQNLVKIVLGKNIYSNLHLFTYHTREAIHYREYTQKEVVRLLCDYGGFELVKSYRFDSVSARTLVKRLIQKLSFAFTYFVPILRGNIMVIVRKKCLTRN